MRGERYEPFPAFDSWHVDFDSSVVDQFSALLETTKQQVTEEAMATAVRVATRYAAVDTGAIEGLYTTNRGFTRTIATQTATWEAALKQHGEHVERSIQDALNGYEYVLDATTGKHPISESWIRQLHEKICASQKTYTVYTSVGEQTQPLPKGVYKAMQNNPTNADTGRVHHYAPVSDTPAEMARLVDQLRTDTFSAAHPVVQAAYAHYAFVAVHPFADGNGRVARALAAVYLYRSPGVPLVIFADQKDEYLDALEAADAGQPAGFVRFVEQRTLDTIELVRLQAQLPAAPPAAESLASLRRLMQGRAGLTYPEIDAKANRVQDLVLSAVNERLGTVGLPGGVTVSTTRVTTGAEAPAGYRSPSQMPTEDRVLLAVSSPVAASISASFVVWPAEPDADVPDLRVQVSDTELHLGLFVRDFHPVESEVLRLKIEAFVEDLVDRLIAALNRLVEEQLGPHH